MFSALYSRPKVFIASLFHKLGYDVKRRIPTSAQIRRLIPEINQYDLETILIGEKISMQSVERLWALIQAVKLICSKKIQGDFVECGVFLGGSGVVIGRTMSRYFADQKRSIFLFDTFEGMTVPSSEDTQSSNYIHASQLLNSTLKLNKAHNVWAFADEESVLNNLKTLQNYDLSNFHLVKGDVKQTLSEVKLGKIAILRLDTDWYESTKIELQVLYPSLISGGILIVDDYGHWEGARRAFDEFLFTQPSNFLHRVDYTCRLLVKD